MAGTEHYSADFKRTVAREALDQDRENLDRLSEKHGVPVSLILTWAVELEKHGEDAFADSGEDAGARDASEAVGPDHQTGTETWELEIENEDVAAGASEGAMLDRLNYKRLIFWSVFGMVLVVIFTVALFELYQYNTQLVRERVSAGSEYYEVNELRRQGEDQLSEFGVVDPEAGIYHIPIDSAMNQMVQQNN
ncbi:MAG: hypothetical protein U5K31_04665 [Balneolaceae bacterium]|nr:hypothetical protein [Balneolaceae bacterium]